MEMESPVFPIGILAFYFSGVTGKMPEEFFPEEEKGKKARRATAFFVLYNKGGTRTYE
jgi:hypothetical protein